MSDTKEEKKPAKIPGKIGFVVAGILVIIALLVAGYFYMQYQKTQKLLQNPTLAAQLQTTDLISAVGKLIELPKDEQPTIATVSDVTKLQSQPFFANAKNGDKVLIYTKARKAILYRPSENRIIDVAPVNIGNTAVSPTPTGKITPTPTKKPTPTVSK